MGRILLLALVSCVVQGLRVAVDSRTEKCFETALGQGHELYLEYYITAPDHVVKVQSKVNNQYFLNEVSRVHGQKIVDITVTGAF